MVTGGHDLIDIRGAAPTLLREGQVHADAKDLNVGKLTCLLVESPRFRVTHGVSSEGTVATIRVFPEALANV